MTSSKGLLELDDVPPQLHPAPVPVPVTVTQLLPVSKSKSAMAVGEKHPVREAACLDLADKQKSVSIQELSSPSGDSLLTSIPTEISDWNPVCIDFSATGIGGAIETRKLPLNANKQSPKPDVSTHSAKKIKLADVASSEKNLEISKTDANDDDGLTAALLGCIHEAMSNDLILGEVLKNLSLNNLKICRQVSHLWCRESTKILLKYNITSSIEFHDDGKIWLERQSMGCNKIETVPKFMDLVSTRFGEFPCNSLVIFCSSLTNESFQAYVQGQGEKVKQLFVDYDDEENDFVDSDLELKALERLLLVQLKNLSILRINRIPKITQPLPDLAFLKTKTSVLAQNNKGVLLPHLKILALGDLSLAPNDLSFLEGIVNSAVNLKLVESCEAIGSNYPVFLSQINKLHLIKKLDFSDAWMFKLWSTFEAISNSKPKLEFVSCLNDEYAYDYSQENNLDQQAKIVGICLESSSAHLKEIQNFDSFLELPGLKMPPAKNFPSLRKMSLKFKTRSEINLEAAFSPGMNFAKTFPNLECLTIRCDATDSIVINPVLVLMNPVPVPVPVPGSDADAEIDNNRNPLVSVTKVCLESGLVGEGEAMDLEIFPYLNPKFPNLTSLKVVLHLREFLAAGVLRVLWSLVQLKELTLEMNVTNYGQDGMEDSPEEMYFPSLEAAFTGFSVDTCLELYKELKPGEVATAGSGSGSNQSTTDSNLQVDILDIEKRRISPSIVNLQGLKKLYIEFVLTIGEDEMHSVTMRRKTVCPLLSRVTGLYAFQLMGNLQVAIHVGEDIHGLWNGLRDICPFVEAIHSTELSSQRLRELEIITESEYEKGLKSDDDEWSLNGNFNDGSEQGTSEIGSEFDYLHDHVLLNEIQELEQDI